MSAPTPGFWSSLVAKLGARSKRAESIRQAGEFELLQLAAQLQPPKGGPDVYAWTLADIVRAREDQQRGRFKFAARLAESMLTDDAIFTAYETRLAPQECTKVRIVPAKGARGESIANEADALYGENGIGLRPDVLKDVHGCLVQHELAFTVNDSIPRADGSRVDLFVRPWPIEWVRWDSTERVFKTQTDAGREETIIHGDGRWTIFRKRQIEPFKYGCVVAAAMVWARHAFANRDWAKGSASHGMAKVIGELAAGVPLKEGDGLSPEAAAFLELLKAIATSDLPVGIRPAGSQTQFVTNTSGQWQVWKELVLDANKAAARIYLGTDGILGAQGGAPGVSIEDLFGVAETRVQGDLECLERCIFEGILQPWAAVNFGDSALAPKREYLLRDTDADAEREAYAKRKDMFYSDLDRAKALGLVVDEPYIKALADRYSIDPPKMPAAAEKAPTIQLAPTDIARVVTVNEARQSAGVGILLLPDGAQDPDGRLTVEEFAAKKAAKTSDATPPASGVQKVA